MAALYAGLDATILITDPASAETIKYAANGFLAMKISFVNAVAAMCEAVGADVDDVVEGIGSDRASARRSCSPVPAGAAAASRRTPGRSCSIAYDHGYNFSMMQGVIDVNDEQRSRMVDKVISGAGRPPDAACVAVTVGVLGLTFKAGTDDLRDSPSIAVIRGLIAFGADLRVRPDVVEPIQPAQAAALAGITLVSDAYSPRPPTPTWS